MLASAHGHGTVRLWDAKSGVLRQEIPLAQKYEEITKVRFSPEGRHLLTVNANGTVYVLRLARPQEQDNK
jgi:WD40 repeat protein